MGYNLKDWKRRIAERTDMSTSIVHLTRETKNGVKVEENLFNILSSGTLKGSSTESGFICGHKTAVCFQDTPLTSLCQNVFYEQKQIEQNSTYKLRYRAFGLMFDKPYAFKKGARPKHKHDTHD